MDAVSYNPGHSRTTIDNVLMDCDMPLLRGPDAIKQSRDMGYRRIIIGVTGIALSENIDFLQHGAN